MVLVAAEEQEPEYSEIDTIIDEWLEKYDVWLLHSSAAQSLGERIKAYIQSL